MTTLLLLLLLFAASFHQHPVDVFKTPNNKGHNKALVVVVVVVSSVSARLLEDVLQVVGKDNQRSTRVSTKWGRPKSPAAAEVKRKQRKENRGAEMGRDGSSIRNFSAG